MSLCQGHAYKLSCLVTCLVTVAPVTVWKIRNPSDNFCEALPEHRKKILVKTGKKIVACEVNFFMKSNMEEDRAWIIHFC